MQNLIPDDIINAFYDRIKSRLENGAMVGHPSITREINRIMIINKFIPDKIQDILDKYETGK